MSKGKNASRNYSILTIKRLYALSGNQCSFPDCDIVFVNNNNSTNFSNICHIEDANKSFINKDRYNSDMTDKERSDYSNLILLCPNHHIETNDTTKYSVESLKQMKMNHEDMISRRVNSSYSITKYPSVLSDIINQIGTSLILEESYTEIKVAPKTSEKINYNNVVTYKMIIEEVSIYQGKLNTIYEEIEKQGSSKKFFLLQNIRSMYLIEKAKYLGEIKIIRENADSIISSIQNKIWNIIEDSNNINNVLPIEVINIGIQIILVDAFMRCKILEEPTQL